MHSNSPPQELILTLPPSFTRSRTDPRPRRGSVVVCREFPTASSNKVGTKLGGRGRMEETRIVKIQNKSGHYASNSPLPIFLSMSTRSTVPQVLLFHPLARFHRRHSFSPFTSIYIVIPQPFFSSSPLPLFEIFE